MYSKLQNSIKAVRSKIAMIMAVVVLFSTIPPLQIFAEETTEGETILTEGAATYPEYAEPPNEDELALPEYEEPPYEEEPVLPEQEEPPYEEEPLPTHFFEIYE